MKITRRMLLFSALIAAAGAVATLLIFDPAQCSWLPKCVFFELSGIYCPGCGATRALYAILHGDVMRSLRCNVMLFPLLITAALFLWKPQWALKPFVAWSIAFAVIIFALLRNLPWYPFTLLVPIH